LKEAEALKKQHQDALKSIQKAAGQTTRLQQLNGSLAALSVRTAVFNRTLQGLQQWQTKLQAQATANFAIEAWPAAAKSSDDPLANVRQIATGALESLHHAVVSVGRAIAEVKHLIDQNAKQALEHEAEARELRRQLEVLEKGAGETARKLAAIQERTGQQSALRELEKAKSERLKAIQSERKHHLDQLEKVRFQRYKQREEVVKRLNAELGPQIRVTIERAGQNSEYASAIVAALRGSGVRSNDVAPTIADQMSPREFVEAVENEDVDALVGATGLSEARAARIIERVNEQGVEAILTASIEDGVSLSLLDGTDYKTTEQLSTGQRCTVVLPLLLKQHSLSLIVDQPEDHLDNAFVVETLIKAISQRKQDGQLIFATHNANIPVLGGADRMIVMASDGARGFVRHEGGLDETPSVTAITSLLEGGMEAFNRRAKFYHSNEEHGTR
jgi:ATPase subunit of ABC transporter with duplicated ATPase domains